MTSGQVLKMMKTYLLLYVSVCEYLCVLFIFDLYILHTYLIYIYMKFFANICAFVF